MQLLDVCCGRFEIISFECLEVELLYRLFRRNDTHRKRLDRKNDELHVQNVGNNFKVSNLYV